MSFRSLFLLVIALGACAPSVNDEPRSADPPAPSEPPVAVLRAPPPTYPLQAWMKANATPAFNATSHERLAIVFRRAAELAPAEPGFEGWAEVARAGVLAAEHGDIEGERAACARCHDRFRAPYKASLRTRPLPVSQN